MAGDGGEHRRRAVAVLDLGAVDHDRDQQAAGVGEDVTLAALDFLSGVEAPDTAAFRGFYALTGDDTGRRAGRAALGLARRDQQLPVDLGPGAVVPPEIKVALHRRAWRGSPGAACAMDSRYAVGRGSRSPPRVMPSSEAVPALWREAATAPAPSILHPSGRLRSAAGRVHTSGE